MVIKYHKKYMTRLAGVYLDKYGMLGYDEAKKWYNDFLPVDIRTRIRPFILAEAERRNLEVS